MLLTTRNITIGLLSLLVLIVACSNSTDHSKNTYDEQFVEIDLQYGFMDELNTFEGTFTKDLIMDGSTTVEFWLSKEDQQSIIDLAEQLSFFDMPNNIPALSGVSISPNPSPDQLRIKFNHKDNTVIWAYPGDSDNINYNNIITLSDHIMTIIQNTDVYKSLPKATGGRM